MKETKRQGRIAHHLCESIRSHATVPHIVALLGFSFHAAKISIYFDICKYFKDYLHKSSFFSYFLPFCIIRYLCRADGLLGDAHDAAHGLVVHAHFVEDEEEGATSPAL